MEIVNQEKLRKKLQSLEDTVRSAYHDGLLGKL